MLNAARTQSVRVSTSRSHPDTNPQLDAQRDAHPHLDAPQDAPCKVFEAQC